MKVLMQTQVAQVTTVQRFAQLQSQSADLTKEVTDLRQQLNAIAQEKEAAAAHKWKRAAERVKRRPEHNRVLKARLGACLCRMQQSLLGVECLAGVHGSSAWLQCMA